MQATRNKNNISHLFVCGTGRELEFRRMRISLALAEYQKWTGVVFRRLPRISISIPRLITFAFEK